MLLASDDVEVTIVVDVVPDQVVELDLLTPNKWIRVDLAASINVMRVMRVALADVAGNSRPEIVVGGKEGNKAATIGYYSSSTPRDGSKWVYTSIRPVGWVMQMVVLDAEGDGDRDIVYTDRERIACGDRPYGPSDHSSRAPQPTTR